MGRLPSYHVSRPRLIDALIDSRVAFLEAGGGFGKSALAAELSETLGQPLVDVQLEDTVHEPAAVARLMPGRSSAPGLPTPPRPCGRACWTAARPSRRSSSRWRRRRRRYCLSTRASGQQGRRPRSWPTSPARFPASTLLVAGRRLAPELEAAAVGVLRLGPGDLAFEQREGAELVAAIVGREPRRDELAAIDAATFGWPAAVVFTARVLARSPASARHALARGSGLMQDLVDELLEPLGERERGMLFELGHLPLLDAQVAAAAVGEGILELAAEIGLPVVPARAGWRALPDPVREELAGRTLLGHAAARRAADVYATRGELPVALAFLVEGGDAEGVAGLIAARPWQELTALDVSELRAYLSLLPHDVASGHPAALVRVARAAESVGARAYRAELLERAASALPAPADGRLGREVAAEQALDLAVDGRSEKADELVSALLAAAGPDEIVVRARALHARGRAAAFRGDPASMLEAEQALLEAATLLRASGEREWQAAVLVDLGFHVLYARGEVDRAVKRLREALAAVPAGTRKWAGVATFLAEVHSYYGALEEAAAVLTETVRIGRVLGDSLVRGYGAWLLARVASLRGDGPAAVELLREAERHPGTWFEHPTGIEFLAEAAEMLARLGEADLARAYVERAEARAGALGHPEIAWVARGSVEVRFGDPQEAERALLAYADSPQQPERDGWRTLLLRAYAALRGRRDDAGRLAARAFEAAAGIGYPELPFLHEPDLAGELAALARRRGPPPPRRSGTASRARRSPSSARSPWPPTGGRYASHPASRPCS